MKINPDLFCISLDLYYLCSDDTLLSTSQATAIISSVTLVCYIMYTMSPEVSNEWASIMSISPAVGFSSVSCITSKT